MELMLKVQGGKGNKGLTFLLSLFEEVGDVEKFILNYNKKNRGKRF
jgi:hypothetical protein